jgi:hypothetical protein
MANRALLVGINAYPSPNQLRGCINDIEDVAAYIKAQSRFRDDEIEKITDAKATTANILAALERLVAAVKPGDRALFHYSGHGAQMPTRSKGEIDGLDEVICPVDFDWSDAHVIRDDDFNRIFSKVPEGVEFVWVSDSCHSGTLTKAPPPPGHEEDKPRMIEPPEALAEEIDRAQKDADLRVRQLTAPTKLNVALISGCTARQTSADAHIDGRWSGAATYFLLRQLRAKPNQPLTDLVRSVNHSLRDARYDQEPHLFGSHEIRGRAFLEEIGAVPA